MSSEVDYTKVETWQPLIFGTYNREAIAAAINDPIWQKLRISLLGTTLAFRHKTLSYYVGYSNMQPFVRIQVTNYVNALKRGGMIK